MKQIGYYAKDSKNNLFQFRWSSKEAFFILNNGKEVKQEPENYEILEIFHSVSQ